MIYVVSGFMRTGTSMMMNALSAGGLDPVTNPSRDHMNDRFGDEYYQPNPNGFYELTRQEYRQLDFPKQFDGKLIKLLYAGLHRLAVHHYRILFMKRHPEEIRQSYEAFFGIVPLQYMQVFDNYKAIMTEAVNQLHNRRDVASVHVFEYRQVVEHPFAHFEELASDGWPIDPAKAVTVVDPDQCRFKLEILEVGI